MSLPVDASLRGGGRKPILTNHADSAVTERRSGKQAPKRTTWVVNIEAAGGRAGRGVLGRRATLSTTIVPVSGSWAVQIGRDSA
jgi:hypothetical protein